MMSHPRVAQVLAGAEQGGAENFYVRLVQGLHDIHALEQKAFIRNHPERVEALRDFGVSVDGFRFGGPLHVFDRLRFVRALESFDPDIVMTWMNRASGLTPRGSYQLVCRLGHYYNLKYYRHADYWVGISKGICDHLVRGGMSAKRVVHIPNFADETPVCALPRDSFNTPTDRPLLLAAGRLHINKGFDTLLQALVTIPDAMLWLAGAGPEEQALKKLCHELGLDDRVRFLGWRNDVTALMRTADLFVCPSRHEGLGSIVMESWAHQCPIVATNSQGPGEVIEDGVTGLVVPVDQPQPLAEAICGLLVDSTARGRLVEQAADHYQRHYAQRVIVDKYHQFYQSLM
ncbi:glycosyltransferase [Desulfuromonas acetoxidans]|uniref:Glycosyl transferase, group 1 n=1 Tax=Desulfuromonas acetoxidans (strain DSM 684 / 11070) TaxID=281689 RepID=Q1K147_DESA6|nr:glycosyltransferase [Desulfuromonas acetoxidans]EAT16161.1 glycosyl transferase, group 1 [Desulfuromonas acetoxidans DSM 684]MBF0645939.1 glycosyltransferase [Desulfuromonas acetoxidans]NVD25486.1 glycosyltransferase [Desulfuromonas acetoxidans]NVE17564.1 glycosyltransferase [Desulfuromonas acetoxidans]